MNWDMSDRGVVNVWKWMNGFVSVSCVDASDRGSFVGLLLTALKVALISSLVSTSKGSFKYASL